MFSFFFRFIITTSSSQDELLKRSTTNTETFLETCVLDADHKALKEHLVYNQVQQSDLDRCLLRGLQMMQCNERELLQVAQALIILLQSGAKWNSDAWLDDQKTPCHIICESPGDLHELLDLMIKSSQQTIIDARDFGNCTALMYAVENANTNCIKCLFTHGADATIGDNRYQTDKNKSLTPIIKAIWMLRCASKYSSAINSDIFDLLLDAAIERSQDHLKDCADYILCAFLPGNGNCIKKLTKIGALFDIIAFEKRHVWKLITRQGDLELLKSVLNLGIDFVDQDGRSVLGHVVSKGNIEAVGYLLDQGVDIPTYSLEVHETRCETCNENILIIDKGSKQDKQDPCMIAIRKNMLEIVKLLDEHGSQSCKSFNALRCAVIHGNVDVVSYLLKKYTYPLNIEYRISTDSGESIYTLLTEPFFTCNAQIRKLLLDHGADPAKPMCAATSANAVMTAIYYAPLEVIARYIRSGVNVNLRSWRSIYGNLSPLEASVLHRRPYVSLMLLISGCSRGVISTGSHMFNFKLEAELEKLMKEWNVYDNNVTPLKQRCRCVILNHLSPRADMKIGKLPLPQCLIKFLGIPELDAIVQLCTY